MSQREEAFLTCGEVARILRLVDNGSANPEEQIVHLVENHGLPCFDLPLRDAPRHHRYLFNRDDVIDWLVHKQSFQQVDDESDLSGLDIYQRLSVRSQNVLDENEVSTVGQIRLVTPRQMSEWQNCGGKTLAELTRFRSFVLRMAAEARASSVDDRSGSGTSHMESTIDSASRGDRSDAH